MIKFCEYVLWKIKCWNRRRNFNKLDKRNKDIVRLLKLETDYPDSTEKREWSEKFERWGR